MNNFLNISEFIHMGGYAAYVWPAYGVTFCVLIIIALRSRASGKQVKR